MKVKFLKKVRNAENRNEFFNASEVYELPKERAELAIKKGFAEKVVERTKPKRKKLEEITIKK